MTAEAQTTIRGACKDFASILKALASGKDDDLAEVLDDIDDPSEYLADLNDAIKEL